MAAAPSKNKKRATPTVSSASPPSTTSLVPAKDSSPSLIPRIVSADLHQVTPCFNHGGDVLACAMGSSILLLSTQTGEPVARFDDAHPSGVTCLSFGPDQLLFSGGKDGCLKGWDYLKEEACLFVRTFPKAEILALCVAPTDPSNTLYMALGQRKPHHREPLPGDQTSLSRGDQSCAPTTPAAFMEKVSYKIIGYQVKEKQRSKIQTLKAAPFFLRTTSTGNFLVTACSTSLNVWHVPSKEVYSQVLFDDHSPREGSLQAVALHPSRPEIATGDVEGRVFLWHTLFNPLGTRLKQAKARALQRGGPGLSHRRNALFRSEVKRWHAHGVRCLAYTPDGHYLLSGGEEAVLVVCQVSKGGHPMTFLPRLGACLGGLTLSQDGSLCALTTLSNALRVLHPMDLKTRWEWRGMAHLSATLGSTGGWGGRRKAKGNAYQNMSKAARLWAFGGRGRLVSNCQPGKLQFFDVECGEVAGEVEVVSSNVVSRGSEAQEEGGKLVPPWVTQAALSCDGGRMVTVEMRVGEMGIKRESLKFWERAGQGGRGSPYVLRAVVDEPHGGGESGQVLSLAYHPRLDVAATCAASGDFALWARVLEAGEEGKEGRGQVEAGSGARYRWICQAHVAFERGASRSLAFSSDGTLLAVACGAKVALWDPEGLRLLGILTLDPALLPALPKGQEPSEIKALAFLPDAPRLVVATARSLVVWDLLRLHIVQYYAAGRVLHLCAPGPETPRLLAGNGVGGKETLVHFAAVLEGRDDPKFSTSPSVPPPPPSQSLVVFNAYEAAPVCTHPLPRYAGPVLALAFVDRQGEDTLGLCYMTRDGVTLLSPSLPRSFASPHYHPARPARGLAPAAAAVAPEAGAEDRLGKRQRLEKEARRPAPTVPLGDPAAKNHNPPSISDLLGDIPTGQLPKPSAIFGAFMSGLLPPSSSSFPPPSSFPTLVLPENPVEPMPATDVSAESRGDERIWEPHQQLQHRPPHAPRVPGLALPTPGLKKDLIALLRQSFRSYPLESSGRERVQVGDGRTPPSEAAKLTSTIPEGSALQEGREEGVPLAEAPSLEKVEPEEKKQRAGVGGRLGRGSAVASPSPGRRGAGKASAALKGGGDGVGGSGNEAMNGHAKHANPAGKSNARKAPDISAKRSKEKASNSIAASSQRRKSTGSVKGGKDKSTPRSSRRASGSSVTDAANTSRTPREKGRRSTPASC